MPNLVGLLHTSLVFDHLQYDFPPSIFAYFKQSKTGWWLVNEARITNWNATVAYGATNYVFYARL